MIEQTIAGRFSEWERVVSDQFNRGEPLVKHRHWLREESAHG